MSSSRVYACVLSLLAVACGSEPDVSYPRSPTAFRPLSTPAPMEAPSPSEPRVVHHQKAAEALRYAFELVDGAARVTFWRDDQSFGLWSEVTIDGQTGSVVWDGWLFEGGGAVNSQALSSLEALGQRAEATAIAGLALRLACEGGGPVEPAAWAALLLPWQLLIKHSPAWVDPREVIANAPCGLLDTALETPFQLSREDPLPWVPGFVLLDAVGAAAAPSAEATLEGPCGARCRGACGPDCDPDACLTLPAVECLTGDDGLLMGDARPLSLISCGSHAGCRDHDACYDACNAGWGCGGVASWTCRRGCDTGCLTEWCFDGVATCECTSWLMGYGPYDMWLDFEEATGPSYAEPGCAGAGAGCQGQCGGESPSGCWCDEACTSYGDCCSDACSRCNVCP